MRRRLILVVVFFLLLLTATFLPHSHRVEAPRALLEHPLDWPAPHQTEKAPSPTDPPPGNRILEGYAHKSRTAKVDIESVHRLLDVFQLLVKSGGSIPLGSNEDVVLALTGKNPHQVKFLSLEHPAIDKQGRFVDRWETPLYFHAISRDRIEIRSAGPDRRMWTGDDIHRNPDGTFRTESDLVPASLFE
jgi:hypothetical protein